VVEVENENLRAHLNVCEIQRMRHYSEGQWFILLRESFFSLDYNRLPCLQSLCESWGNYNFYVLFSILMKIFFTKRNYKSYLDL
jgi:hypothetical protein